MEDLAELTIVVGITLKNVDCEYAFKINIGPVSFIRKLFISISQR